MSITNKPLKKLSTSDILRTLTDEDLINLLSGKKLNFKIAANLLHFFKENEFVRKSVTDFLIQKWEKGKTPHFLHRNLWQILSDTYNVNKLQIDVFISQFDKNKYE